MKNWSGVCSSTETVLCQNRQMTERQKRLKEIVYQIDFIDLIFNLLLSLTGPKGMEERNQMAKANRLPYCRHLWT